MKKKIFYLLALASLVPLNSAHSQNITNSGNDKIFQYKGKVVDSDNNPVVYAHVVNLRRKNNAITDSTGFFKLLVINKDTIRVTGIGFQTRYISIEDKSFSDTTVHLIKLEKKIYDLPTVNIYELRWQIFKSEFMEQKVEKDKTAENITNWMTNMVPSDELRMIFQGARGPGFQFPYKSKAERSRKKVAKLEEKYSIISPKFNDKLITSLTGLKGKDIYIFLQYCNFSEEFLIRATEYEIIEELLFNWENYKKRPPQKHN